MTMSADEYARALAASGRAILADAGRAQRDGRRALRARLAARHARRRPVKAPANVAHRESLTLADHIALLFTGGVGTLWCALLFTAIALVSLPSAIASGNPVVIVGWLSSYFLQLVLLSLLQTGANLDSRHSEARAEADHETLAALRAEIARQGALLDALARPQIVVTHHVVPVAATASPAPAGPDAARDGSTPAADVPPPPPAATGAAPARRRRPRDRGALRVVGPAVGPEAGDGEALAPDAPAGEG